MIDLPDHGYVSRQFIAIDPGGRVDGSLGGPSDIIDRPGYRYGVQYTLPYLASSKEARIFEALLEQGSREDVSYPYPLDIKAIVAGPAKVNGSSPPGAVIPVKGLVPGTMFRIGQPIAVVLADGTGCIHKVKTAVIADNAGHATLSVFPLTRMTFADNLVIEVERPRIRGILSWDGSTQEAFGARPFTFTITERR
jgi:hypothetical protein